MIAKPCSIKHCSEPGRHWFNKKWLCDRHYYLEKHPIPKRFPKIPKWVKEENKQLIVSRRNYV
jgi:hypothetical protein